MFDGIAVRGVTALAATILLVSACSGGSSGGEEEESDKVNTASSAGMTFEDVEAVPEIAEMLPSAVRDAGELSVAMNLSTPPNKFFAEDGSTPIGTNPDLARLLGEIMGIDSITIKNVEFDGIIPGLQSGQFDLSIASMGVTEERLEVLDMIDYAEWGTSAVGLAGEGVAIDDLCGLKVGVQQGSLQQAQVLPALSSDCEKAGDPAIEIISLPSQQDALTQLTSGRLEAAVGDTPVMVYAVSQNPAFELGGEEVNPLPVTLSTKKGSDLTPALLAAMKHASDMPEYQEIFEAWNLGDVTITEPKLY